ncbi:hypothetical protein [Saccharothrix luteola]|uniref:hypothetical protein n=1 Tax=Saccharothrix luteola TaxID=2893018 RepID=UPI0022A89E96|nr:hypothetical protein [Saccharothrix luteola]
MRVVVIVGVAVVVAAGLSVVLPAWLYFVALLAGEWVGGAAGDRWPTRAVEPAVRGRSIGWWFVHDRLGRSRLASLAAGVAVAVALVWSGLVTWVVAVVAWVIFGMAVVVDFLWFRRDVRKAERG